MAAVGVILIFFIPIESNKIAKMFLSPIEKRFQKEIEFSSSHIWIPAHVSLEKVSIADKTGGLYYINTINIDYNLFHAIFRKKDFSFSLKGIKLYEEVGFFNSVADILVIPSVPALEFEEIRGSLRVHGDAVYINDMYACNDKIRMRGSGWVKNDGSLDCDIGLSFSKDITDMVPHAIKAALLNYEDETWMGIKLKAKGNYKKPTIHITADMLKLNIMEGILGND